MRISDWSSDVCSSDLVVGLLLGGEGRATALVSLTGLHDPAAVARVARLNGAALLDMKAASESLVVAYRGRVLDALEVDARSEEGRVEKEGVVRVSSWWSSDNYKKNKTITNKKSSIDQQPKQI